MFGKAITAIRAHTDDDLFAFELPDFHALRAIAAKLGWLEEEPITITCINCREPMTIRPCATFELGPFIDGELDDPELDAHGAPGMRTPTLAEAAPLHVPGPLRMTKKLVRALGIEEFEGERDPGKIARKLRDCDDETFDRMQDAFLATAYPPRLGAAHPCPKCGARNDVDAPYDRELGASMRSKATEAFPSFETFDALAQKIADKMMPGDVVLVVEGGVAACDDGGIPLLGSYVPPFEGSDTAPSHPPEITVYYQTFRAMHEDDGPYDWRAELHETIEHELEHHGYHLAGHDPMDEEERGEIVRETVRTVGKKELVRRQTKGLFVDLTDFIKKTWPLWIVLLIAAFAFSLCNGSGD
jgi:hypothetical protein